MYAPSSAAIAVRKSLAPNGEERQTCAKGVSNFDYPLWPRAPITVHGRFVYSMKSSRLNRSGNAAEFVSRVFAEYGADLEHFLLNRLHRNQDTDDVAQEVYLRLLRLKQPEFVRQPYSYVFHIARQVIGQMRLREKHDHDHVTFDSDLAAERAEHPAEFDPDPLLGPVNADYQIERLLAELSPTHRKVFLLRRAKGLSWEEIATALELSVHTVKKYISEANAAINVRSLER